MDIQNLVIANHHINLIRAMGNYHDRHYIWEIAKVVVPVIITGLITFVVMWTIDNKNKKRWLNDGHIKRKIELEIEIRKFLLGIKANNMIDYEVLANWCEEIDYEDIDANLVCDFNNSFEKLSDYLNEEGEEGGHHYKKIFALMDEYECYVPKINKFFRDFKTFYEKILELKTLYVNSDSKRQINVMNANTVHEIMEKPEHFAAMINTYLCFQDVIEHILKKLTVKKIR